MLAGQSFSNKQGRASEVLSAEEAAGVRGILFDDANRAYDHYRIMLNEDEDGRKIDPTHRGIARELARMNLSLNFYTQWYWKIDLHNLMHFLSLRCDPHAQFEIRAYAVVMADIMKKWVPYCYDAYVEHVAGGARMSKSALDVLKRLVRGEDVTAENNPLSGREWDELRKVLGLPTFQGGHP